MNTPRYNLATPRDTLQALVTGPRAPRRTARRTVAHALGGVLGALTLTVIAAPTSAQTIELTATSDLMRLCETSRPVESEFPSLCDGALARARDEAWSVHAPAALPPGPPHGPPQDAPEGGPAGGPPHGPPHGPGPAGDRELSTAGPGGPHDGERHGPPHGQHPPSEQAFSAPTRLPDAEVAPEPEPGDDPVLAAIRARDYARLRAGTLFADYDVVVSADAFPVWTWDMDTASLVALVDEDVSVFEGAFALDFADAHSISFPMDEAAANDALAALAVGALSVRLNFLLEAQETPWTDVCTPAETHTRMGVRVVSAQLEESWVEAPTARALTGAYAEARVREVAERSGVASGAAPRVEITAMEVTSTDVGDRTGATSAEQSILQASIEGVFTECYVTGLARNASLQGALVLAFSVDEEGRAHDPEIQIDALNDLWVTDCTLASLDRMTVPLSDATGEFEVRASVRFSRQE